jgi:glc operon protein GlcG
MPDTLPAVKLSCDGALKIVTACRDKALSMNVPQCIVVVDAGGNLLSMLRMDGSNVQSIDSAWRKALTAAANGQPSGGLEAGIDLKLAVATEGRRINLPGGLPVVVDGQVAGAVGIGSGTGEQDLEVARAGIAAIAGAKRF